MSQVLLMTATIVLTWFGLQAVHELGHVVAALATGGHVQRVVLHPLTLSRTDVAPNPRPLAVVWGGPLAGVLIPLAGWVCTLRYAPSIAYLARFFAGGCCLANGLYLGVGVLYPVGDALMLLQLGTPRWMLAVFGVLCAPLGLRLWHHLGPSFGLGTGSRVRRDHALAMTGLCIAALLLLAICSG